MGWPSEILELPNDLKELILDGRCVAFIGSGCSADCYGSWCDLINGLCEKCGSEIRVNDESKIKDYLKAAQDAKDIDKNKYFAYMAEHFGSLKSTTIVLYRSLALLPFKCYLTTNFDRLLAEEAQSRPDKFGSKFSPKVYPALDRADMTKCNVFHLHGMISSGTPPTEGSIVLSEKEFNNAYRDDSPLMDCLRPTFEKDAVVFFGCRLGEPDMPKVFDCCKKRQMERKRLEVEQEQSRKIKPPPKRFIILSKPDETENGNFSLELSKKEMRKQENYYVGMGITPVWYVANENDHSALRVALDQLAELHEIKPDYGWN